MQQIISPHFITIINQYGLTFKNDMQHTTLCPSKWHMEERNREEMSSWNNIKGGFGSFISLLHIFSESKTKQSRRVASFTDDETSVEKCTVVKLVVPTSYHVPPLNGLWNCGELLYNMLVFCKKKKVVLKLKYYIDKMKYGVYSGHASLDHGKENSPFKNRWRKLWTLERNCA